MSVSICIDNPRQNCLPFKTVFLPSAHLFVLEAASINGQVVIAQRADGRHDLHLSIWLVKRSTPADSPCQGCAVAPAQHERNVNLGYSSYFLGAYMLSSGTSSL